jgi:hypothetical protein
MRHDVGNMNHHRPSSSVSRFDQRTKLVPCALSLLALGVVGCGEDAARRCEAGSPRVGEGIVRVTDACGETRVALQPAVQVDGQWHTGDCVTEAGRVRCETAHGPVFARLEGEALRVEFEASAEAPGGEVKVQGLALVGLAVVPGATGWLSNGFQSWSQSGVVAIADQAVDASDLHDALRERGDAETLRRGRELSWFYSWVGGGRGRLFAGATSAERWKPWLRLHRVEGDELALWLVSGGAGERVTVAAGQRVRSEGWWVAPGTELEAAQRLYGAALPTRRREHPARAEAGWNSWYELWDDVDEEAVRANAERAEALLRPQVGPGEPLRIVVDDGWQRAWGEWEPNAKFPSGLDGLAAALHAEGFEVGVWLAPLLVTEDSTMLTAHPDWFVAETFYNHATQGRMAVLDPTHPGAAAHLQAVIARVVGWGFDFLKIDFLFAGTWEGLRHAEVTGLQAYHRALALIREAAGEQTLLLAVGAPPHPSFPYVDAWRVGPDIAFEPLGPSWYFAVSQARTLSARWPLCLATLCDPDPPVLRELSRDEVGYGTWVVALAGGGLFLSDDLRALPAERWTWGLDAPRVQAALGEAPAVPLDPFPEQPPESLTSHANDHLAGENRHVLPARWRLPDGTTVGFNHTDTPTKLKGVTVPAHGARELP